MAPDAVVPSSLLQWVATQLRIDPASWPQYAQREKTRREHLLELRTYLGLTPFGLAHFRQAVYALTEIALQTDRGFVLAGHALDSLRAQHVIGPALDVVEHVCAEAITRANRRIYAVLTDPLSDVHCQRSADLLKRKMVARRHGWRGCASRPPNRTRVTCSNTSSVSKPCKHSTYLPTLAGRYTKIDREGGQMTPRIWPSSSRSGATPRWWC